MSDYPMPGMVMRAFGRRTTNTRPPTLKPARAKAHRPYSDGSPYQYCKELTVFGGAKGTGTALVYAYYWHSPITGEVRTYGGLMPLDLPTFRQAIIDTTAKHGYTIVYWPKELRP